MSKVPTGLWWLLIGLVAVVLLLGWTFRPKKETTTAKTAAIATPAQAEQWQLSWEKKPEHIGKTGIRSLSLPAQIEKRNNSHIIISYSFPGGSGVMEGISVDGVSYDGQWKDSTGWGKWHLHFVSSDTAFGWSDDGGKGEKVPNVLVRTKGGLAHASGPPPFFSERHPISFT
jgi:hypothetical protein